MKFSEFIEEKLRLLGSDYLTVDEAYMVLEKMFIETDEILKKTIINENSAKFFPTNKYSIGWDMKKPIGITHYISGGIQLFNFLKWVSSFNYYDETKARPNNIVNNKSTAFIVDLDGSIYNLINIYNNQCDIHDFTHRAISITFINAGKLIKKDDCFYWHGGKKGQWTTKYPYDKIAVPLRVGEDYHQPLTEKQIESSIILHRLLISAFGESIIDIYGNTILTKIIDTEQYVNKIRFFKE